MILMIDNYDSFTHNLVHLIGGLGEEVVIQRNDAITPTAAVNSDAKAFIISPGPGAPKDAGICLDLIRAAADAGKPVFGVCLGMQAVAEAFGASIIRAEKLMHGKICDVVHEGDEYFTGLPSPFTATRYHSLAVNEKSMPAELDILARAEDDHEIMAIKHKTFPIGGVQFHPESIASDHGAAIVRNFLMAIA
ncbi:MAG: aminodeoxychorismate/anthranilate synthase component II [Marinicaulis sp.]|nr:aminodeoxychorismate/anthranilate synthase component II [Marinicaulis sp.]NNE40068.1 aminodeoxychorismate/anthranilate synthase component II [Marinicaulis sp.]NNL88445.1 aminodeoxychorismate/anthranilate synthase component II [Marinicaulis sp.]